MAKFINLKDKKFNHLTVIRLDDERTKKKNRTYWICECDCIHKNITSVRSDALINSSVSSCGNCNNNTYEFYNEYIVGRTYNNNLIKEFIIDIEDFKKLINTFGQLTMMNM